MQLHVNLASKISNMLIGKAQVRDASVIRVQGSYCKSSDLNDWSEETERYT